MQHQYSIQGDIIYASLTCSFVTCIRETTSFEELEDTEQNLAILAVGLGRNVNGGKIRISDDQV